MEELWVGLGLLSGAMMAGRDVGQKAWLAGQNNVWVVLSRLRLFGGVFSLALCIFDGNPLAALSEVDPLSLATPLVVSISSLTVGQAFYLQAMHEGELATTLPMLAFTPVFAAVLTGPLLLGEYPSTEGLFAIALIVAGSLIVTSDVPADGPPGQPAGHGAKSALALTDGNSVRDSESAGGSATSGPASGGLFGTLLAWLTPLIGRPGPRRGPRLMLVNAAIFSVTTMSDTAGGRLATPASWALVLNFAIAAVAFLLGRSERAGLSTSHGGDIDGTSLAVVPLLQVGLVAACDLGALRTQLAASAMGPAACVIGLKRTNAIWGLIWGRLTFGERIGRKKITGVLLMVSGSLLMARAAGGPALEATVSAGLPGSVPLPLGSPQLDRGDD